MRARREGTCLDVAADGDDPTVAQRPDRKADRANESADRRGARGLGRRGCEELVDALRCRDAARANARARHRGDGAARRIDPHAVLRRTRVEREHRLAPCERLREIDDVTAALDRGAEEPGRARREWTRGVDDDVALAQHRRDRRVVLRVEPHIRAAARRHERCDAVVAQASRDETAEEPRADDEDAPHADGAAARGSGSRRQSHTRHGQNSRKSSPLAIAVTRGIPRIAPALSMTPADHMNAAYARAPGPSGDASVSWMPATV